MSGPRLNAYLASAVFVVAVGTSCMMPAKEFTVRNSGSVAVDHVAISSAKGFEFTWGVLSTNIHAGMLVEDPHPLADTYTFSWRENDRSMAVTFDLGKDVPLRWRSRELVFRISSNDVVQLFYGPNAYKHGVFPGYDSIRLPANVVERRAAEVPAVP